MQAAIQQAITILKQGGIIAYPTEGVFGLGSDPFNEMTVKKLLHLKHRSIDKGLILLAASWAMIEHLTISVPENLLQKALQTWPGPKTWVFPARVDLVPIWIRGNHNSIAIRITAHPVAKALCEAFGKPIVSTSANIEGLKPSCTISEITQQFPEGIDYILEGKLGGFKKPTPIYDVLTGDKLRD
jgi:L-threonylcarbamoyladenylate synthase